MPRAISRPSEPVDTVSMSMAVLFLPSRMIEPLAKLRSIWDSAASSAFDLSIDDPSTRRSAAPALMWRAPIWPGFGGHESRPATGSGNGDFQTVHDMFHVRNMFFSTDGCCPNSEPLVLI